MCSIGEEDFDDDGGVHAMIAETLPTLEADSCDKCSKCSTYGPVYKLQFRQVECRDCFLLYVRHKFRATLGSSKILPRNAKVLLVFDGSAEAMVLLDMLHHAQTQNNFKRLHCETVLLHIDDQLLQQPKMTLEEQRLHIQRIKEFLALYEGFQSFVVPIGANVTTLELYSLREDMETYMTRKMALEPDFGQLVEGLRSLTARQDFVKCQRSHLIAAAANKLSCGFAFVSDISTALAADLLSAVVLGRGGSAALDVALVDDRLGAGVKLVRALKDLNEAEVQLYLRARDLKPLLTQHYGTEQGAVSSLQNLTHAFVDNLQQNFSSTVSTVFRTGDKIAPNRELEKPLAELTLHEDSNESKLNGNCAFCHSTLDNVGSATLLAIEFSRLVSQAGTTLDKCGDLDSAARSKLEGSIRERRLCHACRSIQAECPTNAIFNSTLEPPS